MSIIELEKINLRINGEDVLKDITFSVQAGEYIGLIGTNGGGKTTLLRVMLGLDRTAKGSTKLFGEPLKTFRAWPKIGYLSQRAAQVDLRFPITVAEVVSQGRIGSAGIFHRLTAADQTIIEDALATAEVTRLRHRLMEQLSGGQRQRVLIARALASQPELLVLDEPLVGVDTTSKAKFYTFIKKLNVEQGMTIIFISHDIEELAEQVTRLIFLNREILIDGPPDIIHQRGVLEKLYGHDGRVEHTPHHHEVGSYV